MELSVFFGPRASGAYLATAVDTQHPDSIWQASYDSRHALARQFFAARWISPEERDDIESGACFVGGMPVLHVTDSQAQLERMQFLRIHPVGP